MRPSLVFGMGPGLGLLLSVPRSEVRDPSRPVQSSGSGEVRLVDAVQWEVYVCFEGSLGAHFKQEVRVKIWQDDYIKIYFHC